MREGWEAVIGLEVHAQLKTASKIFCGCSAAFGDEPNANTCAVCLGLPGALPVLNRHVVISAAKAALALGLKINTDAQVISSDGEPIAGLYAAGELVGGIFWFNYPGGSGLTNGAVFGRIAGRSAATRAA